MNSHTSYSGFDVATPVDIVDTVVCMALYFHLNEVQGPQILELAKMEFNFRLSLES